MDIESRSQLAEVAELKAVAAEEALFSADDDAEYVYVILVGHIGEVPASARLQLVSKKYVQQK